MTILPVGTIIYAKYTYGDEVLNYHFYRIEGYTSKGVRITRLESEVVYDDGKEGPHYYDAPYHVQPKMINDNYVIDPNIWKALRKIYLNPHGEMRFKPEEFYTYQGVWNGKPLVAYNYH